MEKLTVNQEATQAWPAQAYLAAEFPVAFRDVDFTRQLKLSALFGYFQEMAGTHAEKLGFGIKALQEKHGVSWMLVRIRVELAKNPQPHDVITIRTWPLKPNRIEFARDFLVTDQKGEVLARAASSWVIFDVRSRKLVKAESIDFSYPVTVDHRAMPQNPARIRAEGELAAVYEKTIAYSDIDVNGHLNNSRYIDFIMDCFSVEQHKTHTVSQIEVNYVNEALPGETIQLCQEKPEPGQDSIYIEGKKADGTVAFRARLKIRPR